LFPADAAENSTIEDAVSLPEPYIPPIVFVRDIEVAVRRRPGSSGPRLI